MTIDGFEDKRIGIFILNASVVHDLAFRIKLY